MDWIFNVQKAINYIEDNLFDDLNPDKIATHVFSSNANFQRIFGIVTGITIGDYIRNRRLSLAGRELSATCEKVIEIAYKYGYETAESFTKAFYRFHGVNPSSVKNSSHCLKYFAPLSIQINIEGGFNMTRKLIPNVPLITMSADGFAYLTSFTGALYGALKSLCDDYDYAQILAYSGFGNRLCWSDGKWVFGNEIIENCNLYPFESQSRLLNYIGWRTHVVSIERNPDGELVNIDEKQMRRDFVDSINKGIPVLAQGITNDGCKHDYSIFFGFEEDGRILIGWDYYQNDNNPLSRENWEKEIKSYILLTDRVTAKTEEECIISMFKQVVKLARIEEIRGKKIGIAAWQSFLHQLETDDFSKCSLLASGDTPPDHDADNVAHRFIIYCDALTQISQRSSILPYYKRIAEAYPKWANEINAAISAWEKCAKYGGFLWSQGFSFDESGYKKFQDAAMRKILADEGRKAMYEDIEAVDQIEKILSKECGI